jgi:cyclopropane fatty-acyl-phospholipid synthase-like methyltransferase
VGDALDLTPYLGSRRFDTIVAAELIEHLERPYDFLRGLGNFLSDDGRIVLSTPNPVSWPVALFEVMRSSKYFYSRDHVYYFTPRWMNRMLERCGFTVDAVISVGLLLPLPGIVLPCPVGLSYHVIYVARSTPV